MSAACNQTQGVLPGSVVTPETHSFHIAHADFCRHHLCTPSSPEGNLLSQQLPTENRP